MVLLPHSVDVVAAATASVGGKPGTLNWAGTRTAITCQITPMKAEAAFSDTGVEVSRPHLLITEPGNSVYLPVNAKVIFGTRNFYVIKAPEVFTGIMAVASNCSCVLSEDK